MFKKIVFFLLSFLTVSIFSQKPNVLLITLDTTRADYVGIYNQKRKITPNIDALAEKGIVFEECRCNVPLTLPSHANLLTGKLPSTINLRVNGLELSPKHIQIQEIFKKYNYNTYAFVSSIILEKTRGLSRGFDFYDDRMTKVPKGGGPPEERRAAEVTDAVIKEIDRIKSPYFLWIHYYDPHYDYNPPSPYKEQFSQDRYAGEVAYMDAEIGRLIKEFSTKGKLKNTLIVIVGDHGEGLGEHGERQHGIFLYEYALHVPFIMVYEGVLPSKKSINTMCSMVDIAPTILEICGIEEGSFDGRSLLKAIKGEEFQEKPFYIETYHGYFNYGWAPLRGIMDREYKFINAPRPELYRYRESEFKNLLLEKPEIEKEFRKELEKYPEADKGEREQLEKFLKDPSNSENLKALISLGYISGTGLRPDTPGLIDPKDGYKIEEELREAQEIRDSGDLERAIIMLKDILKRNPTNVPALSILGGIYLYQNRLEEARICFIEQIKLKPQMDGAHLNLGTVYKKMKNYELAEKEYKAALTVNPRMSEAVANLMQVYIETNRLKDAKELFEKAISQQIESGDVYFEGGIVYAMENNLERAKYCFAKSLSYNPLNHQALANLGKIAFKQNKFDEAISYYERATKIALNNSEYYAAIGSLYLTGKNDIDKAIYYYRKALSVDPYGKNAKELKEMIEGLEREKSKK